jgi:hypothetical protein
MTDDPAPRLHGEVALTRRATASPAKSPMDRGPTRRLVRVAQPADQAVLPATARLPPG